MKKRYDSEKTYDSLFRWLSVLSTAVIVIGALLYTLYYGLAAF
ncbi:hypothetical protein MJA45_09360 [Paenibacillus aurantius]|uniref:Uncharacterized protein n=1 Tax=Paenibacillus aurantius TaxID=2918900 RepID=A0AA96RF56_9BACL|nr:hypothetical protein [Paenibacillus aurantius]WNQ13210.1 hypothetical protein MJA45_09360 [Paenibacillus aurantius]